MSLPPVLLRLLPSNLTGATMALCLGTSVVLSPAVSAAQTSSAPLADAAMSTAVSPSKEPSSAEKDQLSQQSAQIQGSSTASFGSSILSGPLFAPLHSSLAESTPSSRGEFGVNSAMPQEKAFIASDIDYGPSPKLLDIKVVHDGKEGSSNNYYEIKVWSPANHAIVRNSLILPAGGESNTTPRPTLYLFSGAHGGDRGVNWHTETNFEEFFAGKSVNVVGLLGGAESMYADWYRDDPVRGRNQWQTYMGEELPQIMRENFHDNGIGAIAGCSMGGAAALLVAAQHPERFKAAGSLSGYPAQSGLVGRILTVGIINEANAANLYGLPIDPAWQDADPAFDPWSFKNTKLFIASSWGIPTLNEIDSSTPWYMGLEIVSQISSNFFYRKADAAGIDVTRYQHIFGAHSYSNFEQELYAGWEQVFAPALEL